LADSSEVGTDQIKAGTGFKSFAVSESVDEPEAGSLGDMGTDFRSGRR
jgi:hypothetical protein